MMNADRSHPTVGGTSIKSPPIAAAEDWALATFADGEVDCAGCARHKWDHRWLAALPHESKGAVAAFGAEILHVGRAGLRHAQTVQPEQNGERGMASVEELRGEQEPAEFTAVHARPSVGETFGRRGTEPG
jgi:hypothetical protein